MDPTASNDLIGLGGAALVVVVILKLVFDYVSKRNPTQQAKTACSFSVEEKELLRTMAIQVAAMHTTLQVTRDFQKAFEAIAANQKAIVENQTQQTEILREMAKLNARTSSLLNLLTENNTGAHP